MSNTTNSILTEIVRVARAFILRRVERDAIELRPDKPRVRGPLTSVAKDVLRTMTFQFANILTGLCHPSLATIAAATGCSESSVKRHLPSLREAGYVEWRPGPRKRIWTRKGWRNVRSSNRYHLTCPEQYLSELHAWLLQVFRRRHGHLIKLVVSRFTPQSRETKEETRESAKDASTLVATLARDLQSSPPREAPPASPIRDTDPPSQGPPAPQDGVAVGGMQVHDPALASVLQGLWTALEKREPEG